MELIQTPAASGYRWLYEGFLLFRKKPFTLSFIFLVYLLGLLTLSLIPIIGSSLSLLIFPITSLGFFTISRSVEHGQRPRALLLISGFLMDRRIIRNLLLLGLFNLLGSTLITAISFLFEHSSTFISSKNILDTFRLSDLIIMLSLTPLLAMLFWFAPALVGWHNVTPVKAMFFSFMTCWRNWKAFFVYSMSCVGIIVLAAILYMLLNKLAFTLSLVFVFLFFINFATVLQCSFYKMYEECLREDMTYIA